MKKPFFAIMLACIFPLTVSAQTTIFKLDPILDSALLATGIGLEIAGHFLPAPATSIINVTWESNIADIISYDAFQDHLSTYAAYGLLLSPGLIFLDENLRREWIPISIMYTEAFLLADGLKNTMKKLMPKLRPYVYLNGIDTDDPEYYESFPSGHTTLAFMSAGFITTVFILSPRTGSYALPIAIGAYSLAGTIATLRITSGAHFISDVLSGALIGSAIGILVPLLHHNKHFSIDQDLQGNIALCYKVIL